VTTGGSSEPHRPVSDGPLCLFHLGLCDGGDGVPVRSAYEVHERGSGITCATFEAMAVEFVAYVSKPCAPFAFGEFMGAFRTVEDARQAAHALNVMDAIKQAVSK